jgi:hypothetical protein
MAHAPGAMLDGQLVRLTAEAADSPQAIDLSARNSARGRIAGLMVEGLMAEVRVAIGDQELVSVITRERPCGCTEGGRRGLRGASSPLNDDWQR